MAPPSIPALTVQSHTAPCLFFLFVCFSTRRTTRAFIFSCTRFLDNSFPVLLGGNKSAPPRVLLRPLISGAGNEMRWLSSRTTSLSWFPFFLVGLRWQGDGMGGVSRGSTSKKFVLLRQLKCLYCKKKKKTAWRRGLPPRRLLVVSSKLTCLTRGGSLELGLWFGKLNYLSFASIKMALRFFKLHFHSRVRGHFLLFFFYKSTRKDVAS